MGHTVGLVTDSPAVTVRLQTMMEDLGQTIAYTMSANQVMNSSPLHPSLWVVVSEQAADVFDVLSDWSESPIFLTDDIPPEDDRIYFDQWCKSLRTKLCETLDMEVPEESYKAPEKPNYKKRFDEVWVLAASLGGPEAVRVFLANVHPDLPVTFIYAQHIEENFDQMLPRVVGKQSNVEVVYASHGEHLKQGVVTVIPSHYTAEVDERGMITLNRDSAWLDPYTPNIDQVIDNISDHYQDCMGIIIFSGMCDDGAAASIECHASGVPLWAQEPDDCICPGMPESVINKNSVDFVGNAQELAFTLNDRFGFVVPGMLDEEGEQEDDTDSNSDVNNDSEEDDTLSGMPAVDVEAEEETAATATTDVNKKSSDS